MEYKVEGIDLLIKNLDINSKKALLYCGEYLAGKIQEQIEYDSYDTGMFARSITYRAIDDETVEVGSALEYAAVIEYGRMPGKFPPLDALVGWTARKGMISGGATSKYDDLYYKDKGVVFLIARAIATRGIEGKHIFENVTKREEQNVINLYTEYMNRG